MATDVSKYLKYLPEIGVSLCFFPTGLAMGYLLNFQYSLSNKNLYLRKHCENAIFVNIGSAVITAFILHALKLRNQNREHFQHIKLIIFGICMLLFTGVSFFMFEDKEESILTTGAIGHGVIYISGLCYINLRITRFRALRLSVCSLCYILGISVAANFRDDKLTIGLILSTSSSAILILLVVITTLNRLNKVRYDCSLDEEINTRFYTFSRNQLIEYLQTKFVLGKDLYIGKVNFVGAHFYMVFIKIQSVLVFQALFLVTVFQRYNLGDHTDAHWAATGGVIIGILILCLFSTRILFIISCSVSPILLVNALANFVKIVDFQPYDYENVYLRSPLPYFLYIAAVASSYFVVDMAILDTSPVKWTEVYLAIGFTFEKIVIYLTQFLLYDPTQLNLIVHHIIFVLVVSTITLLIGYCKMPNTFDKSLAQIKFNLFWGIKYGYRNVVNEIVPPISAGGGTPTPTTSANAVTLPATMLASNSVAVPATATATTPETPPVRTLATIPETSPISTTVPQPSQEAAPRTRKSSIVDLF